MNESDAEVAKYQLEASAARARIAADIDQIERYLSPQRLIGEATEALKGEAAVQIEQARRSLQRHPYAVGAMGALAGLWLSNKLKD